MDEKRGITDEEFREAEKREREKLLAQKFNSKFRVIVGGRFKDFEDIHEAEKYLERNVMIFGHAALRIAPIMVELDKPEEISIAN